MFATTAFSFGFLLPSALAHMHLHTPAPFNSSNNPHRTSPADPWLDFPRGMGGESSRWTEPCHGYLNLLDTPEGATTATWTAGTNETFSLHGVSNHYGGSCQAGFSTDGGQIFRVATSYEGNCPHRNGGMEPEGQTFDFQVPADLPSGKQVFAWVWVNREQEVYHSCAAVEIIGADGSSDEGSQTAADASSSGHGTEPSSSANPGPSASPKTYTTANDCTCTCPSPADITTCTCTCPSADDSSASEEQGHPYPRSSRTRRHVTAHAHKRQASVSFADRPLMFFPYRSSPLNGLDNNIKDGRMSEADRCLPLTTAELKFPDPGPEIVEGDGEYPLEGLGC